MPYKPKRPCGICGKASIDGQCPAHAAQLSRSTSTVVERQRRQSAVLRYRQVHGDWCTGYQRAPHSSYDLTADHETPTARGGLEGPLRVLCRSCNSRRGNHTKR